MTNAEKPAVRSRQFERYLRRMQRVSRLPWSCVWLIGSFLCRNRLGRLYFARRSSELRRQLEFSLRLFKAMGVPQDRVDSELTQVYQNGLFQPILLARLAASAPQDEASQFEVEGWEHLEAERAAGRPIIMGGSHFGVNRLFSVWLARQGVQVLSLAQRDWLQAMGCPRPVCLKIVEIGGGFTADTALLVMRHLRSGGCLQVTGDWQSEQQEPHSYERRFWGLSRRYPQGMANFSLMGGAAILPYFCTLQPDGRVRISIHPPLRPPASSATAGSQEREAQLEDLVQRFAAVLEAEIERSPGVQRWT